VQGSRGVCSLVEADTRVLILDCDAEGSDVEEEDEEEEGEEDN
jgi:hypothetical protein